MQRGQRLARAALALNDVKTDTQKGIFSKTPTSWDPGTWSYLKVISLVIVHIESSKKL